MRSPGSTKLLLLLGLVSGFAPRDAPCRGACRLGPRSLAADPDGPDDVDRLLGRVDDLEGRLRRLKDATDLATPAAAQAEKVDATDSVLGAAALAAAGAPAPRVAPCAAAFEIVRAERPALWRSLFQEDGYHPTPRGSLLLACVLYETIFEKPPALDDVAAPATLWSSARYFGGERDGAPAFPTADECRYLGDAARRAREKRKRC